jgi:hypothetical protein
MLFLLCIIALALLAANPVEFYLQHRRLEDWIIYRFVVCYLLGTFGLMLLLATALTYQMSSFGPRRGSTNTFWPFVVASVLRGRLLILMLGFFVALSVLFLWPGIVEYSTTGRVTLHWSRLLAGAFSLLSAFQIGVFALLLKILSVWRTQHDESEAQLTAAKSNSKYFKRNSAR